MAGVVAVAVGIRVPDAWILLADACRVCGGLQRTAPPRFNEVPKLGSCTRGVTRSGEDHGAMSRCRVLLPYASGQIRRW